METTGKSLYFHIPFCKKKCPYCHFFVVPDDEIKKDRLLNGFYQEWDLLGICHTTPICSIYFGGGTPSLFGPLRLGSLLDFIKTRVQLDSECEITLEINPCDVDLERMHRFKQAGVTRVSLGVQSFHDSSLITIGRQHTASQAVCAIDWIYKAGFNNISIDLMYDRPLQSLQQWQKELAYLDQLPISHVSLYNMTIEQGSAYKRREQAIRALMPEDTLSFELHQAALEALQKAGFERYEISAFAKNNQKSVHNLGYWQGRPFYGLGPSAFSYLEGARMKNVSHFNHYLKSIQEGRLPRDFSECLEPQAAQCELLAIGLRVLEGVRLDHFQKKQGLLSAQTLEAIAQLKAEGYLVSQDQTVQLTQKGQLFYDDVGSALVH